MTGLLTMADLSRVATGGLLAAVWQGILLTALAWLGLRLLPKTPAAVRFIIWFAVFLLVAALPVASLWPHAAGAMPTGGGGAWLTLDGRWSVAIAAVWAVASLIRAGTLVMAAWRVRTLWKRAVPVDDLSGLGMDSAIELRSIADPVAMVPRRGWGTRLSWGTPTWRRAQICTSEEVDRPTVIGFFAPKILIPAWLLEKLTAVELEQIVLHESGHLGRADDWMNLLQKIALVVFPLNPALAWVERRLCFERELACDERVLRTTQAPKAYAACLATLAEHRLGRRGLALALGALGRESELGRRVHRILRRGETMRPVHAKLVLGGAMLGLLSGAVGLERCPQVIGFARAGDRAAAIVASQRVSARLRGKDGDGYQAVVFHAAEVRDRGGETASRNASGLRADRADGRSRVCASTPPCVMRLREDGAPRSVATETVKHGAPWSVGNEHAKDHGSRFADTEIVNERASRFVALERQIALHGETNGSPSFAATRAVRWVVVTAWQGEDGSRLVLTTARIANNSAQASVYSGAGDASSDGPEMQQSKEVYPYAAVPVRGGWLVFQL